MDDCPDGNENEKGDNRVVRHLLEDEVEIPSLCLSVQEKLELRDVLTSAIPSLAPMVWVGLKTDSLERTGFLSALLRTPKETARVSFDRNIGPNGLLFFLHLWEDDEQTSQVPIWLLLRLVTLDLGASEIKLAETKDPVIERVMEVHDWKCKECMYGKDCEFDFKSIDCIDGRTLAMNVQINYDPEVDLHLYATVLNAKGDGGTLSFPFRNAAEPKTPTASPKKDLLRRRFKMGSSDRGKEKEREKEKEKEKESSTSLPVFPPNQIESKDQLPISKTYPMADQRGLSPRARA